MKIIIILSSLIVALSSGNVLAADANITFNGIVSVNTCTLAAGDATKVLTLPNVTAATLYAAGYSAYTAYYTSSSFNFTDCPVGLTKISSNYTYQGALMNFGTGIAKGTASNILLVIMQSTIPSNLTAVAVDGTSGAQNQVAISSNSATVPVIAGIWGGNSAGVLTLPSAGTYSGIYTVAFTYS